MKDELVTPDTRIGELLAAHPEIEDFLVGLSPRFAALRTPSCGGPSAGWPR